MNELIDKIEELRLIISSYVSKLLGADEVKTLAMLSAITPHLSATFPQIVSLYELEEMSEYKEDQQYWLNQLERIMAAFESNDRFLLIDVLLNETSRNLEEVERIMVEKGLV